VEREVAIFAFAKASVSNNLRRINTNGGFFAAQKGPNVGLEATV
jgi:hypothetical protein